MFSGWDKYNDVVYKCEDSLNGTPISEEEFESLGVDSRYSNHVPASWADEVRELLTKWQANSLSQYLNIVQVKEKFCELTIYYDKVTGGEVADMPNVAEAAFSELESETIQKLIAKGVYPLG